MPPGYVLGGGGLMGQGFRALGFQPFGNHVKPIDAAAKAVRNPYKKNIQESMKPYGILGCLKET